MKNNRWIIIGLLLALVISACGIVLAQAPVALQNEVTSFEIAAVSLPESTFEHSSGLIGEQPELAKLIRDIIVLRQINQADLSPGQIEKILPILRSLAKQQNMLTGQMKKKLLEERARLLREKGGGGKPAFGKDLRKTVQAYRAKVEDAKVQIGKLLSVPQAEIIGRLISSPELLAKSRENLLRRRNDRGHLPQGKEPTGQAFRQGLGAGSAPTAGMGQGTLMARRPLVDLSQLISLLEEKLAAMRGK